MFKLFIYIAILCASINAYAFKSNKHKLATYKHIVEALAHDSMHGRATSTIYEDKSANFIVRELKSMSNIKASIHDFSFLNKETNTFQKSKNVYYYKNNHAKKTILIGAHYDHIGLGETRSLSYSKKGQIHNGADDNASGVALQISLLNTMPSWSNKKYNYLFVWYSAHEIGLYGSAAFKEFCENKFTPIAFVLNFDMVGRLDKQENILTVYGYSTLQSKNDFLQQHQWPLKVQTNENDIVYQTDAGIFAKSGIPSVSFTTGIHDDYHKVSDDAETINYEGMLMIQDIIETFLHQINL